jgi:hypothetical protein
MTDSTAALSTRLLRTSDDPLYRRLRELLSEHGIDLASDVLADLFPDDGALARLPRVLSTIETGGTEEAARSSLLFLSGFSTSARAMGTRTGPCMA